MYLKLINMNYNGKVDYKGLDLKKFIAGTQVYDIDNKVFLVKTNENVNLTNEILSVTEEEYIIYKKELEDKIMEETVTIEQRLDDIEMTILEMAGVI